MVPNAPNSTYDTVNFEYLFRITKCCTMVPDRCMHLPNLPVVHRVPGMNQKLINGEF